MLSSWADMVLVLFGIGVLGFSFWYRHAFGNVTFNNDGEVLHLLTYGTNVEQEDIDASSAFLIIELRALRDGTLKQAFGLSDIYDSFILTSDFDLIAMSESYRNVISTSLEEILLNNVFTVFPNPAGNVLNIEYVEGSMDKEVIFELISLDGKRVLMETTRSSVRLDAVDEGMYIYRVWDDGKYQSGKLTILK